jgi:hypothetical protein
MALTDAKAFKVGEPLPTPLSVGGIPPATISPVKKGSIFKPGAMPSFTPTGFSASDELAKRRAVGEPLAASYRSKRLGEVAPLEDKLSKMKQGELDDKFRMENLGRKFDASRSGTYGSSSMADSMSRAYKDQSRQRASSRAETAKFGHGLTSGIYDKSGTLSTMAARGELGGSGSFGTFDPSAYGTFSGIAGIAPYRPTPALTTKMIKDRIKKKKVDGLSEGGEDAEAEAPEDGMGLPDGAPPGGWD